MPVVARKLGNWAAELRRAASDLRKGLEAEVGDVAQIKRDLVEPMKSAAQDVRAPLNEMKREVEKPVREMKDAAATPAASRPKNPASSSPAKPLRWIGPMAATAQPRPGQPLRWVGPTADSGPTADDAAADLALIEEGGESLTDQPESLDAP